MSAKVPRYKADEMLKRHPQTPTVLHPLLVGKPLPVFATPEKPRTVTPTEVIYSQPQLPKVTKNEKKVLKRMLSGDKLVSHGIAFQLVGAFKRKLRNVRMSVVECLKALGILAKNALGMWFVTDLGKAALHH